MNNELIRQKEKYEKQIDELQEVIENSRNVQKDLELTVNQLRSSFEGLTQDKSSEQQNKRIEKMEAQISELQEMAHQQSGLLPDYLFYLQILDISSFSIKINSKVSKNFRHKLFCKGPFNYTLSFEPDNKYFTACSNTTACCC